MIAGPPTVWGHVAVGAYVDAGGRVARVDHVRYSTDGSTDAGIAIALGVAFRDGTTAWLVGHYADPITILVPTGTEAVDAVKRVLGGEVIAVEVEHLPTDNSKRSRQKMRDHLVHMHGMAAGTEGETKHIVELLEAHTVAHSQWRPGEGIPHVHVEM